MFGVMHDSDLPQLDSAAVVDQPDPLHSHSPSTVHSQPCRTKKTRREKTRIALAPDQPLTTQGKPRARVYVACLQWYVLRYALLGRLLLIYTKPNA